MKVAILSVGDPMNHRRWSGTPYYIISALHRQNVDTEFITSPFLLFLARSLNFVSRRLGLKLDWRRTMIFARLGSLYCSLALRAKSFDVVLSIAASPYTAFLRTDKPIISITDATYVGLEELYPEYETYPSWMNENGRRVDRLCFMRSTLVVVASEWAAKSAVDNYAAPRSKIVVAPFGANLPGEVLTRQPVSRVLPPAQVLRLLYVSVDWERKRGDIAVETARLLNRRGIPTKLVLVGKIPETVVSDDEIEVVGYLRKSDPDDLKRLVSLFRDSHFLILPTIADCFGVVFTEAQAFSCPSLTYGVGGTPDAVLDGVTGAVLPLGAPAEAFADKVQSIIADPAAYQVMCDASREQFDRRSNWDTFANSMFNGLDHVAGAPGSSYRSGASVPLAAGQPAGELHAPSHN